MLKKRFGEERNEPTAEAQVLLQSTAPPLHDPLKPLASDPPGVVARWEMSFVRSEVLYDILVMFLRSVPMAKNSKGK